MRFAALVLTALLTSCSGGEPLPDFRSYQTVEDKKQAFFDYLRPLVEQENQRIQKQRQRLLRLLTRPPRIYERKWLSDLARQYRVPSKPSADLVPKLLKRVDVVPLELALSQAAIESAWGTSRFARLGNNLYGQWCYQPGCGIVPLRRVAGAGHEVRRFDEPQASVAAYVRNLNSHRAYQKLRDRRSALRAAQKPLTAEALALTLNRYSERGQAYVQDLMRFIRMNKPQMLESSP